MKMTKDEIYGTKLEIRNLELLAADILLAMLSVNGDHEEERRTELRKKHTKIHELIATLSKNAGIL